MASAGSVFGLALALASEGLINRFFQWRYDTALLFVHVTPSVAARAWLIAVPLGRRRATVVGVVAPSAAQRAAAGPPMSGAASLRGEACVRQPARAALGVLGVAAVGALLFDMLMLSDG